MRYDQVEAQLVCICVVDEQWLFNESYPVDQSEWDGSDGLWHFLTIEIEGDQMVAACDGEVIFEHSDILLTQMPKLGLIELSNTFLETCFDDILLMSRDAAQYLCGDADGNGRVNVTDAVYLVQYIFAGGPAPEPILSADANCDGSANVSDAVYLIQYIFVGGPAPCDTNNDGTPDC